MSTNSYFRRFFTACAWVLTFATALPRLGAVTNDELIPANLVGKTLSFTYGAGTPNTLETVNNFTIQFTSSSLYVRSATGLATEGGTYTVLDTSVAANGTRQTTLSMNNNWLAPGSTTAVLLTLTQASNIGAYAAAELFNPLKNTGGTFTIGGGSTGGGTVTIPAISSAATASATVGTPFTYQVVASNSPTAYAAVGLPTGLSINATTGLISGTPTGTAGTSTVSVTATNSSGTATLRLALSIAAATTGGGSTGGGSTGSTLVARTVTAWGWNLSGQTSVPSNLTDVIALGAGGQTAIAVKSDGTVTTWGAPVASGQTAMPANLTGVTAVTGGSNHIVALKSDGSLVMWGDHPGNAQRNGFPTNNTGFTAVSAKYFHTLALRSDGTVVSFGADPAFGGLSQPPAGLTGVKAIAAGVGFDLALKTDGTVVAWASPTLATFSDNKGQATVPAGLNNVVAIAAGQFHALALKADGTVVGWGGATRAGAANTFTVPANAASGVAAIACGFEHSVVLKTDGTVVAWGLNSFGQATVPSGLSGVKLLAANEYFNLAASGDGTGGTTTPPTTGDVSRYAGRYTGFIGRRVGTNNDANFQSYSVTISSTGAVNATIANFNNALTGTVAANGIVTFTGGVQFANYGITTGVIEGTNFLSSYGSSIANAQYRFESSNNFIPSGTTTPPVTTAAAAPTNLVGYRNKVGGVYQFTVTGSARGAVWGTDVYTDDSAIAAAAVHAGVLADGATGTVTVTILPGQSSYPASTRNGVSAASWGAWSGSYSFAGAGAISTVPVATARPAAAPGFVAGTTALAAGGRLVCPVAVTGGGTYSYRWYLNGNLIAGATANPYIVESLTAANAGTYSADVTNALGTTRLNAGTVTVGSAGSPVLALQPISKSIVPGATFTLATSATGTGLTYQWLRNGSVLAGETGAILLRNNANAADAGNYSVRVSNSSGTVTSNAATVAVSAAASRPANISVRTNVATGTLVTPAFVLKGSGTKRILIRAAGPALAAFGLPGTMENPKLTVFRGSTELTSNDDWSPANIGQAFTATGAFAFPNGSKDAALVVDLPASPTGEGYSVQVTNASGTGGLVLVEVYDADILRGTSTSLIVNVSVRGQTAPGADVLTLGLVIGGQGPRTLLVRGIGPKLASFGVTGTVPDPRLQIVDSQGRVILANDDWASADFVTELALASTYVGAFALDAGSKDAATLSLVEPGAFTIQVSGTAANPSGEALVEVYDVP